MGRIPGAPSRIYIDEFNFSGRTNAAEQTVDVNLPEVTCFSDTAAEFVEALYNTKITINGFFEPTDDGYDEQMWTVIGDGVKHYVGFYPGQDASHGDIGYEIQGQCDDQARPIEVAGAVLLNVSWQGEGPTVRSTVLCNGAVTGTGAVSNSNKNLGATTAGEKFVAVVRVLSVTGSGSIDVEIEESSDDGSADAYATITGMTQTFTDVGVSRESTTSATEAWKRVNVTAFTGFTSVTLLVTAGKEQGVL